MNPSKFLDASYTEFEARLTELEDAFVELLKGSFPASEFLVLAEAQVDKEEGFVVELYIEAENDADAQAMESEAFQVALENLDPDDWEDTSSRYEGQSHILKARSFMYVYGVR